MTDYTELFNNPDQFIEYTSQKLGSYILVQETLAWNYTQGVLIRKIKEVLKAIRNTPAVPLKVSQHPFLKRVDPNYIQYIWKPDLLNVAAFSRTVGSINKHLNLPSDRKLTENSSENWRLQFDTNRVISSLDVVVTTSSSDNFILTSDNYSFILIRPTRYYLYVRVDDFIDYAFPGLNAPPIKVGPVIKAKLDRFNSEYLRILKNNAGIALRSQLNSDTYDKWVSFNYPISKLSDRLIELRLSLWDKAPRVID